MTDKTEDIAKEVHEVLEQENEGVLLEDIANEQSSPLNEAVKEKDIAGATEHQPTSEPEASYIKPKEPLDAPEQDIHAQATFQSPPPEQEEFDIPKSAAGIAADAILGTVNNYIGVGAGFFIRIRKHKEFYDFDDIIRIVDEQNEKNIQRIKFDEEDIALLRPLIVQVIQKRAKKLTPEQQLLSVLLSIMVKKAQVIFQIRAENELLTERILDIIREEKGTQDVDHQEETPPNVEHEMEGYRSEEESTISYDQAKEVVEPNLTSSILEVATDEEGKSEDSSE